MSSFATNAVCADDTLCSRELMKETVNVMNKALHGSSPHNAANQEKSLGEEISNGKTLRVLVFSADDMEDKESVAIKFEKGRVKLVQPEPEQALDGRVRVSKEHLLEVSKNPESFVDEPLKLELVWVKHRMTESEA